MPLSKAEPRRHVHTREIRCDAYERDDGLWDIEGSIIDTKSYSFDNADRGGVAAGEPAHHMRVRMTVDDDMVVHTAEAVTEAGPYNMCGDIAPDYANLAGLKIGPGWKRNVIQRLGGPKGCTHISDLVMGPLAVTAFQAIYSRRKRQRKVEQEGTRPALLDTCHSYATNSPIVERQWPQFFKPAD